MIKFGACGGRPLLRTARTDARARQSGWEGFRAQYSEADRLHEAQLQIDKCMDHLRHDEAVFCLATLDHAQDDESVHILLHEETIGGEARLHGAGNPDLLHNLHARLHNRAAGLVRHGLHLVPMEPDQDETNFLLLLRFEDMQRHAEGIAAVIPNYAEMQMRLLGGRHRIAIRMPQQVRRFYGKGSTIE